VAGRYAVVLPRRAGVRGQVDPLPDRVQAPLEPPREPITGDSHAHLFVPLDALASELSY
jgi:hypothetical protein